MHIKLNTYIINSLLKHFSLKVLVKVLIENLDLCSGNGVLSLVNIAEHSIGIENIRPNTMIIVQENFCVDILAALPNNSELTTNINAEANIPQAVRAKFIRLRSLVSCEISEVSDR